MMEVEEDLLRYGIDAIKEKIGRRESQTRYLKETKEYKGYKQSLNVLENYRTTIEKYEYKIRELNQQLGEQPSDLRRIRDLEGNVGYLIENSERHDMSLHTLERKLKKIEELFNKNKS
jgi:predicted ATP-binding protein involved in virulence